MDPHSDFLEKNPVCLAWYHSKYSNRKTVDQRKSKFTKQEDSCCKCEQFCVDTFSLPISLVATRAVPIPFPRALTRSSYLALWPVEMFTLSHFLTFRRRLPVRGAIACGVAGLVQTFPSFTVSGPFLPDAHSFISCPPDRIPPPQLWSSSRGASPPSSFRQLL